MTLNKTTTLIDLFCGCGGLSYGFSLSGFSPILGIDNDKSSLQTYFQNHKNSNGILGDITDISINKIINKISNKTVDIIVGGPPCQGFSLSGKRDYSDPRNRLFLSYMEIVEKLNPRAIVLENVPGFISLYGGKAKEELINSLVKMDYSVTYKVLLAADYGVPQMRKRVIFIGLKNTKSKFTFPDPTHSPKNSLFSEFKSYVTCEDAISDLPPLSLQGETGEEIQEYHTSPQNEYQQVMRRNSTRIINHVGTNHTDKTREIISMVPDGGNYKDLPDAFKNSRNFHVAWTRFRSDLPAPTIDTGHRHHFHYKWNRVPTVREAARIQSFPDVFEFIGNKTQQNRQVGNAVPPLLAKAIADKLKEYL